MSPSWATLFPTMAMWTWVKWEMMAAVVITTLFSATLTWAHVVVVATQGSHRGDWYFPDGTRLPFSGGGDIFEYRVAQRVDLHRRNNANSPVGIYRCDIPTVAVHVDGSNSVRDTVYVGLYTASGGD